SSKESQESWVVSWLDDDSVIGGCSPVLGIKKLEKKCKPSISHHRSWLKSVQRLSMKKSLERRRTNESGRLSKETEKLVSIARPEDSTVRPDVGTADLIAHPPTTTSIFDDEDITMA
nr:hypothetical protein [Tanacetum cinerariifolium]